MNKKLILIIIFILSLLVFVGCGKSTPGNDPEVDPDEGKEIVGISVDKTTIPEFIDIDEFDLSVIKVIVEYSDSTTREMPLKEDMIDTDVLEALKSGSSKRVTITYKDEFACTANIATKDYGANDPKIGDNDVIILLSRDKASSKLLCSVLSITGVSSIQCTFAYDNTKISLDINSLKAKEGYDISAHIEDNKLTILLIAKNETLMQGNNELFSINYSGNYREAAFVIDEDSNNRVLRFENGVLLEVSDVNYFFSLK